MKFIDWARKSGKCIAFMGITVLFGCAGADTQKSAADDDFVRVGSDSSKLYVLSSTVWASPRISVCWESSSHPTEQAWVRNALSRTWEAESAITFTGWNLCSAGSANLHLLLQDSEGGTGNLLGNQLNDVEWGVRLNTWESTLGRCQTGWTQQRCVEATAVHEIGHALGFAHEQNRADTPLSCDSAVDGTLGDTTVGAWDLNSVMNYCNPLFDGDGRLSPTDVQGVQQFYGSPRPVSAVSWGAPRQDLFVRASNGELQTIAWVGSLATGSWSSWSSLGGNITSAPYAVSLGSGLLDVFARGSDGSLVTRSHPGTGWNAWENLGGAIISSPVAVARQPNIIDVFARNTDGGLSTIRKTGSSWGTWTNLGHDFVGLPAAAAWDADRIDVFVRSRSGNLESIAWTTASGWSAWGTVEAGTITSSPSVVSWGSGRLDVFFRDTSAQLRHAAWPGWTLDNLGGGIMGSPTALSWGSNHIDVFVVGSSNDVYTRRWAGSGWSSYAGIGGSLYAAPAGTTSSNRIDLFGRNSNNNLAKASWVPSTWTSWDTTLGGTIL